MLSQVTTCCLKTLGTEQRADSSRLLFGVNSRQQGKTLANCSCLLISRQLCDFLESHYLNEQVEAIKKLGDYITNLTRMDAHNNKMAEYLFDKHTMGGKS